MSSYTIPTVDFSEGRESLVLMPNGQPFVIKQPKQRIGFILKSNLQGSQQDAD